jgi:hypothetical protein
MPLIQTVSVPVRSRSALVWAMILPVVAHAQVGDIPELQRFLNEQGTVLPAAAGSLGAGVPTPVPAPDPAPAEKRPTFFYANPGPWGKLKCFYIYIEAPRSMVEDYPLPFSKPRWSFPESERPKLPALFKKAGLPETFAASLIEPLNTTKSNGLLHLFPPLADLEAMTPAMREVIYPELAKHPTNEYHADPVLITTDTVDEWYRTSKLRPELVAKIRQMSYHRGDCLAFSDLGAMMNHAAGEAEARLIFKSFTRTRSLMVQMELDEEAELAPLLDYWTIGIGIRRKDIEPIMQSIIDTEGVERLGLTHIIPALPRKLLYTYPGEELSRHGVLPDCHWTCLNFFNYEPHEYLLDSRLATTAVLEKFDPTKAPYKYGDILFFIDAVTGDAFHSCVYLADDMVFTKNGRNPLSPWVIMKVSEVEKIYIYDRKGRIQGYRHKKATGKYDNQ